MYSAIVSVMRFTYGGLAFADIMKMPQSEYAAWKTACEELASADKPSRKAYQDRGLDAEWQEAKATVMKNQKR